MVARRVAHFAGVMGWPLDTTLSPAIHNAAFRKLGLEWVYLAWPVPPESLAAAIEGMRALGAAGANITMPHKQAVIAHLDELSADAAAIGAVNTVERVGESLVGHNTDVDGFKEFLIADVGLDASGTRALILGAGGAARAVVAALVAMGAGTITVAARQVQRAREVAELAHPSVGHAVIWDDAAALVGDVDIVVNATPLGSDGADPFPGVAPGPGQLVVDLLYFPPTTPLVDRARAAGADAWGGMGMLVHQAAASFRIWTGLEAPLEVMSAAAVGALGLRTDRR